MRLALPLTSLNNRPQHDNRKHSPVLVLLDHGLYKQLPTDFRLDYWWVVCFGVEWMHSLVCTQTHITCVYNPRPNLRLYRTHAAGCGRRWC